MSKQAKLSLFFKPSATAKEPKAKRTVSTKGLEKFTAQVHAIDIIPSFLLRHSSSG
jgi:hypothetical protein